jgi:nitrogen regulatory protein P-II 1
MTVTDVRGCGPQGGITEVYRGAEFQLRLLPKVKLETGVNDAFVDATIEAIVHSARTGETGQIGDGKIFVVPLKTASASAPANAATNPSGHNQNRTS